MPTAPTAPTALPVILDVAIVGGGISGVYSGWRLVTDTKQSRDLVKMASAHDDGKLLVTVFEGSDRIGGRLLSVTPPGMPRTRCELGGMRYLSSQPYIRSLVENKLKLPNKPFVVENPNNIAYLRRKHLRQSELADYTKVPYDLDWAERGMPISDLMGYAINQIVPGFTSLASDQMEAALQEATFEDKPLYQWGFWNLLARTLSHEAYCLVLESGGYDTVGLNWNAVDTILLNFRDFGPTVKYTALVDGYESVPHTVCKLFTDAGGKVLMNSKLRSFTRGKLPDGKDGIMLTFHEGGQAPKIVYARSLVLAMPRRSLELIEQTGPLFDPGTAAERDTVQGLIQSVTPIPLFKLFICYPFPWWQSIGLKQGQSVTDMPLRQCYYWATESQQPGGDPKNKNSVMLGTYDDTLNVGFWAGLESGEDFHEYEPGTNRFVDASKPPVPIDWLTHKAPRLMADEVHRQLQEMHGVKYVPKYYAAAFRDWGADPYGGGVNWWNIHEKSWEIIPRMVNPVKGLPVYVCGEAYSAGQGWVEGALQTAEIMLKTYFGLPDPAWLT